MAKYQIACDEMYPVYYLYKSSNNWGDDVEISDELYEEYTKAEETFDIVQGKLNEAYKTRTKNR